MEYIHVIKIKYIVENTTDHNAKYKFQVEQLKQTLKAFVHCDILQHLAVNLLHATTKRVFSYIAKYRFVQRLYLELYYKYISKKSHILLTNKTNNLIE